MFALGCDKAFLLTNPTDRLTDEQKKLFGKLIAKRAKRIPVAYLTGTKEFMHLKFTVNKDVLVPRPETERLVEEVVARLEKSKHLRILDIGTGSGAIIVSLAKILADKHSYFASDVSIKALDMAKLNAKKLNVKINFKHSSLLKEWQDDKFDVIIANLPYLPEKTESTKHEPKLALVAKNQGLHIIKTFLMQAKNLNSKPSLIFLEIGHNQGLAIKNLAKRYLPDYKFKLLKDYSGFDRLCVLSRR